MESGQEDQAGLADGAGMMGASQDNIGAGPVRTGFELDVDRLEAWLAANVAGFSGPVGVEQFHGGQSNPTYRLTTSAASYVLRRRPPGPLLKGAHAIDREARVICALEKAGFPVAHVHALCTDEAVIGSWFYVMDLVEGRIFWDAALPDQSPAERGAIYDAMNATLAQLHGIDAGAVGLGDFGRPGNYFERQIARWSRQYLDDPAAGRDDAMDALIEWLPVNVPEDDATAVIHGDFRIDNIIFHPDEPRVLAVLDWELSTLGHPGADFAYSAMTYRMPPDIVAGLRGADVDRLGIPDEAEYLRRYCERTGRASMPGYDFYIAFNFFRLAAIFHGISGRVVRGTAASAQAAERARAFPRLAALGMEAARQCR